MVYWWLVWPVLFLVLFLPFLWWPSYKLRGDDYEPWNDWRYRRYRHLWQRGRDPRKSSFRGRGPFGYQRADERIVEDVSDALLFDDDIDAGEIRVSAQAGVVTLAGTVNSRAEKKIAESIADAVPGVIDVHNDLGIGKSRQKIVSRDDANLHPPD